METTNRPYVFISYAHANSNFVVPCIEALKRSGIEIWYDDGIEAGSEWPEYIAEKVVNCTKFLLFVSDAYLQSQNCRRELNFAISRKKDILSIYLGDVNLSPGMEMQLGTYQAIYRNRFDSAEAFYTSLCKEHYFDPCRFKEEAPAPEPPKQETATNYSASSNPQPTATQSTGNTDGYQSAPKAENPFGDFFNKVSAPAQGGSQGASTTPAAPRKKLVAAVLAFFLGFLGLHRFYLRQHIWGAIYLLATIIFTPGLTAVAGMVEAVLILVGKPEILQKLYKQELA